MNNTEKKSLSLGGLWSKFIAKPGAGVLIALILFILLISVITGGSFLSWSNIVNVFNQQCYIGIIACGMTLVILTGNIDLSVGSQLTFITVMCAFFSKTLGDWSIPVTLLLGVACGAFNALFVCGLKLNAFITTLASGSIFGSLTLIFVSGHTVRSDSPVFNFIGTGKVLGIIPSSIVIVVAIILVFAFLARRTVFGQRLYAIGANPNAARFSGIRSRGDVAVTYILCGLCCAVSAIVLISRSVSANPQIGASKEMEIILAVVLGGTSILGGKGSVWGTVVGFLFLGFMSSAFTFLHLNTYMQWIIMGVILIAALALDVFSERGRSLWKSRRLKAR